jgi:hypothetical protein
MYVVVFRWQIENRLQQWTANSGMKKMVQNAKTPKILSAMSADWSVQVGGGRNGHTLPVSVRSASCRGSE